MLAGLFIDGDTTDYDTIYRWYEKKEQSFNPEKPITQLLTQQAEELTFEKKRTWILFDTVALLCWVGSLCMAIANLFSANQEFIITISAFSIGLFLHIVSFVFSLTYYNRSDRLVGWSRIVHIFPLLFCVVFIVLVYKGVSLQLGIAYFLLSCAVIYSSFEHAKTEDSVEGAELSRRLTAARRYFSCELEKKETSIAPSSL